MNWQDAIVAVVGIFLVIVLGSVLIWQIFKTGQVALTADAAKKKDAEYLQAIADAAAAQQVTAARLAELSEDIKHLQARFSAIEQILRQVE